MLPVRAELLRHAGEERLARRFFQIGSMATMPYFPRFQPNAGTGKGIDYRVALGQKSAAKTMDRQGMTSEAAAKLKSDGFSVVEATGFIDLVGPMWQREVDGAVEFALATEDKHHNRRGLVQGGVLMTFADRACGMTARHVTGKQTLATVQLDMHFVESGKIGETLITRPHVVRATRSLIFVSTEVTANARCVAMASGVFKILKDE
jgi:acyl-coenzyme A thioesterase PaaI-like protein